MRYDGVVSRIRYKRAEKSFYIFDFRIESGHVIACRGSIPGILVYPGVWLCLDGEVVNDKKWGRQIQITRAPIDFDKISKISLISMLTSIGMTLESFALGKIKEKEIDISKIEEYGISEDHLPNIINGIEKVRTLYRTPDELSKMGVPVNKIGDVIFAFGASAIETVKNNPWSLSKVYGISIQEMDEVAKRVGKFDKIHRISGIINFNMKNWCQVNTYIPSKEFLNSVVIFTGEGVEEIIRAVKAGTESGDLVVDKETVPGTVCMYIPQRYHEEVYCAREISSRVLKDSYIDTKIAVEGGGNEDDLVTIRNYILKSSEMLNIVLDEDQILGLINVYKNPVSVITGLPGTGKSTSIKVLTHSLNRLGARFCMMAPTGVAAKRLSKITGFPAGTIHRTLKAKANEISKSGDFIFDNWEYNENNPLSHDVFIVDESSMVDQFVMSKLLKATSRPNSRIVFVGDVAQLPSVGYGDVLKDIIKSGKVPVVSLTKIYRQAEKSQIVFSSHDIHYGRVPESKGDFSFVEIHDENEIYSKILNVSKDVDGSGMTWQVLSPKYAGTVGVDNLNSGLRDLLNPVRSDESSYVKIFDNEYRVDDKIMIIKNEYTFGICNGDIGVIKKIDHTKKTLSVLIMGETQFYVNIAFDSVSKLLRLAYACTVHKYQGMEVDVVIMPLVDSFYHQLQRNLLYTAVTRAKKKVFLFGSHTALVKAVRNNEEDKRKTLLSERINK